ncbi:acyl carrier protein [Niveibacterium sp. 24ML]|uniref:acyl carrier protein n=1 Tax=Niveibacterium sp. 24ML TaxID=2985512 RepID=UPI00226DD61A|nr:acyl carrier protein [Niveibacterium sp. 24ML]MCX9156189.1 acyl carrier protein [Niveibacterium sp. 24ML]
MSNLDRLRQTFSDALAIPPEQVVDELRFNSIPQWDSVAHMALVAAIESAFDIMLDTDDVIDMSSFAKSQEIVRKYDVAL